MKRRKSVRQRALSVVVGLLSAGWVVPLYLGFDQLLWSHELSRAGQQGLHSFPSAEFGRDAVLLSAVWLFIVLATWAGMAFNAHFNSDG